MLLGIITALLAVIAVFLGFILSKPPNYQFHISHSLVLFVIGLVGFFVGIWYFTPINLHLAFVVWSLMGLTLGWVLSLIYQINANSTPHEVQVENLFNKSIYVVPSIAIITIIAILLSSSVMFRSDSVSSQIQPKEVEEDFNEALVKGNIVETQGWVQKFEGKISFIDRLSVDGSIVAYFQIDGKENKAFKALTSDMPEFLVAEVGRLVSFEAMDTGEKVLSVESLLNPWLDSTPSRDLIIQEQELDTQKQDSAREFDNLSLEERMELLEGQD